MQYFELNHIIHDGLVTYQGLEPPHICDFWTRDASAASYDDGSTFHIGKIEMVANTGTYIDVPFHRFADGDDLAEVKLKKLVDLEGILIDCSHLPGRVIPAKLLENLALGGKAVLFKTGWDRHWKTATYFGPHPFLEKEAAEILVEKKAALAGIDAYNIDDANSRSRQVHTLLLGAGIPIVEHLCGLDQIPHSQPFRFSAVPPRITGLGSFPVRAYASIEDYD